jgi:hypothetical protein
MTTLATGVIFLGVWMESRDIGIALTVAIVTAFGMTAWWVWAKRWGRYRDREPWEDDE